MLCSSGDRDCSEVATEALGLRGLVSQSNGEGLSWPGMGFYCSSHAWIGLCAPKENRAEGKLPSDRDMALIALRAGQHARQIPELGSQFEQIRVEFERAQNFQRDAEHQAVQSNLRLSAASAVVHHGVNVSRAEVHC